MSCNKFQFNYKQLKNCFLSITIWHTQHRNTVQWERLLSDFSNIVLYFLCLLILNKISFQLNSMCYECLPMFWGFFWQCASGLSLPYSKIWKSFNSWNFLNNGSTSTHGSLWFSFVQFHLLYYIYFKVRHL